VKRIINGRSYDTDTATRVASGDHGHESSQAWWALYRTNQGAYFEVVADHDGSLQEFRPLTDQQAYAFMEVHANDQIEKYFGAMPEASKTELHYSRRTIISAIDVLESRYSQAEITSLLTDFGPHVYRAIRSETDASAKRRMNDLKQFVDAHPAHQVDDGLLENVFVERAASLFPKPDPDWSDQGALLPVMEKFKRALEQDGFVVTAGSLRRTLPADIRLPGIESDLVRLLDRHGFGTAKGHLEQAMENHARGNWAAANGQLRTFFDALLDGITERLEPGAESLPSGQPRRAKLAALDFLSTPLNEWNNDGKGFINGLVKRLHPQGAHPGLSDDDDCTFRLHIVLLTAALLLRRFDAWRRGTI
jgi:hypothetical protein